MQRLTTMTHIFPGAGASANVQWQLTHNPAGQIAATTRINDAFAWTGHYAVSRGYTANGLNQYDHIATAGGSTLNLSYDLNGNLIGDGGTAYVYDVENRLVSAAGGHNATLTYDPLGRLWQVTAPVTGGTATTRFLYDGDALVAEYDAAGTMQQRYVHWVGADVPVVAYSGATLAQPTWLHADQQGSIVALSNASGIVTAIDTYDEYGIPGAANAGRFQYTGQAWLAELGMYYYKARIYSPTLGRFLQTDPVGYHDQINLYGYVGNDPVDYSDPTGMRMEDFAHTCNTAESRLCSMARQVAQDHEMRQAREGARSLSSLMNLRNLGAAGLVLAILSLPGDTPVDNRSEAERFGDAFLDAANEEQSGRKVGFHYTTQANADRIRESRTIAQNNGRTYFTNVPFSAGEAHQNLFLGFPDRARNGEAVVIFTYDPRTFRSLPDPSVGIGRVHAGSIRSGSESVRFQYVGPNHFPG